MASKQKTSETQNPFFSIIIPTRNEEQRLSYCLPSLLNQSYQNFEILVIDDPETSDNTADFITSLKSKKITYFQHKKGLKVPAKRNIGSSMAKGDYLYMIDADMEFPENTLESLANQLTKKQSDLIFVAERTPGNEWVAKMKDFEKQVIQKEITLIAARIYKKDIFTKSGGYLPELIANEEVELSDRLITEGATFDFSEASVNHYETSGNNLLGHLKKKFKYGITVPSYTSNTKNSAKMASKRVGMSRLIYFTSKKTWENPILGVQFVIFKSLEMGAMILGLIYGKITKKQIITTK